MPCLHPGLSTLLMSTEKRLILFVVLTTLLFFGTQPLMEGLGLIPRRRPAPPAAKPAPAAGAPEAATQAAAEARPAADSAFAGESQGPGAFAGQDESRPATIGAAPEPRSGEPTKPAAAELKRWPADGLVLGAADAKADPIRDFRLQVEFDQQGAGVRRITLGQHAAEAIPGQPRDRRLTVMAADPALDVPPPFALSLIRPNGEGDGEEFPLGHQLWEVVPGADGSAIQPVPADPTTGALAGQSIAFRTRVEPLGVEVTKTFTLRPGRDSFELQLNFRSDEPRPIAYKLDGPQGIPIEGEWFTSNFREIFFGKIAGQATEVETHLASEVLSQEQKGDPIRVTTLPLKFAGVENQYFTVFFEPSPLPATPEQRIDDRTVAELVRETRESHKSDVTVAMIAKPVQVAPNAPVTQSFRIFAGPKTAEALTPYGAEDLASYRKGWQIPIIMPLANWLAKAVIAPLLDRMYAVTRSVASLFGGSRGNYGIAIILLTITVRLMLFPLSRKQAVSAKKMQDLQPQLTALREKYGEDKEKIGRETWAIYQKNGVNPMGGCLLALIQMPIFFGLWQALNNSVALRGAPFLWIDNLAAPDQLFKFPTELPFLGPYFNLLPFVVVLLMLAHMKLFSPPPATAEQEQQQQIMKYMMIFMAFMFYKVPSGLGLYFITSSTWAICERLLLPKHLRATVPAVVPETEPAPSRPANPVKATASAGKGSKPVAPVSSPPAAGAGGWKDKLRERIQDVMDEAAKDRTYRKEDRGGDTKRPRPKPGRPR